MARRIGGSRAVSGSVGRTAAFDGAGRPAETPPEGGHDAYCPHCQLLVTDSAEGYWPKRAARCPHCRLLIGAGRARRKPAGRPGARGSAAGVFAGQARRGGEKAPASADDVREAIRDVAAALETPPERLLMVDYQQHAAAQEELPPLHSVFAAFGSWKKARRAASRGQRPAGGSG